MCARDRPATTGRPAGESTPSPRRASRVFLSSTSEQESAHVEDELGDAGRRPLDCPGPPGRSGRGHPDPDPRAELADHRGPHEHAPAGHRFGGRPRGRSDPQPADQGLLGLPGHPQGAGPRGRAAAGQQGRARQHGAGDRQLLLHVRAPGDQAAADRARRAAQGHPPDRQHSRRRLQRPRDAPGGQAPAERAHLHLDERRGVEGVFRRVVRPRAHQQDLSLRGDRRRPGHRETDAGPAGEDAGGLFGRGGPEQQALQVRGGARGHRHRQAQGLQHRLHARRTDGRVPLRLRRGPQRPHLEGPVGSRARAHLPGAQEHDPAQVRHHLRDDQPDRARTQDADLRRPRDHDRAVGRPDGVLPDRAQRPAGQPTRSTRRAPTRTPSGPTRCPGS